MSVSGQRSELYDSMWVMLLLIKSCVKAKKLGVCWNKGLPLTILLVSANFNSFISVTVKEFVGLEGFAVNQK